ncbi:MAG TPA: hypothetical protein PK530_15510 [Anaerolineales bacterium]|nr:hypothetical protein [Anaerolineales bacterium]
MPTEEIVGWAMEATLATILVEKAFLMAVANRRTVLGLCTTVIAAVRMPGSLIQPNWPFITFKSA